MTVKTPAPADPFRWLRYTQAEYDDVLFKRQIGRAMPGYWDWTPKQRDEIRAQYPDISDEDFEQSYWICEGACMLCGEPLNDKKKCPVPTKWFSLVPLDERRHTTHFENIVDVIRRPYWHLRWWLYVRWGVPMPGMPTER